jgi:hypothetical protein
MSVSEFFRHYPNTTPPKPNLGDTFVHPTLGTLVALKIADRKSRDHVCDGCALHEEFRKKFVESLSGMCRTVPRCSNVIWAMATPANRVKAVTYLMEGDRETPD